MTGAVIRGHAQRAHRCRQHLKPAAHCAGASLRTNTALAARKQPVALAPRAALQGRLPDAAVPSPPPPAPAHPHPFSPPPQHTAGAPPLVRMRPAPPPPRRRTRTRARFSGAAGPCRRARQSRPPLTRASRDLSARRFPPSNTSRPDSLRGGVSPPPPALRRSPVSTSPLDSVRRWRRARHTTAIFSRVARPPRPLARAQAHFPCGAPPRRACAPTAKPRPNLSRERGRAGWRDAGKRGGETRERAEKRARKRLPPRRSGPAARSVRGARARFRKSCGFL